MEGACWAKRWFNTITKWVTTQTICGLRSWPQLSIVYILFFFQAEDGIRDLYVTGVQTCALPILCSPREDVLLAIEDLQLVLLAQFLECRRELNRLERRDIAVCSAVHQEHGQANSDRKSVV